MTPLERAIAAVNNTALVQDIAGDQQGVLGIQSLFVVTNPEDVARAVIAAIREPSDVMSRAYYHADFGVEQYPDLDEVLPTLIDAILTEPQSTPK